MVRPAPDPLQFIYRLHNHLYMPGESIKIMIFGACGGLVVD